jgi:phosphoglycolate phosphatase-like HAD superfamily hydrolase
VDRAARELGIVPERSFTVGDRWVDVQLARALGGAGVLVRTGYGQKEEPCPPPGVHADAIVNNLVEATGWILQSVAADLPPR